jgi:hypothetical protein
MNRFDLLPVVLAPGLEWIWTCITAAEQTVDWTWAARQLIARYEWDFMTWLNRQKRAETDAAAGSN